MYNTEVCSNYIKQRTIELKQIFGACNHFLFWGSKSFILYGKSNFNDFQWYDEWKLPVLRLNHLWGIWNSGVQTHLRFVLVFHPWHKTQFVSKINFKHETVRHAWGSQKQNKHPYSQAVNSDCNAPSSRGCQKLLHVCVVSLQNTAKV